MAADLLLPENALKRDLPGVYMSASQGSHASHCMVQGGGTHPRHLRDNIKTADPVAAGKRTWSPVTCKWDDLMGQGRMWDWWHIACLHKASHAALHHDGFPEMMLQWGPAVCKDLRYEDCRQKGIELCTQAIQAGLARA